MDTQTQPAPPPSEVDDVELHIICCDDNTGLCGAEVTGDFIEPGPTTAPVCRRCLYLRAELVPCTHPQCGAR